MSNDAEVRAREVLAHEFSKRGQPSVALAIRRGNLNEDGPYAPAVAAMLAFAAEARSHDGEWEAMRTAWSKASNFMRHDGLCAIIGGYGYCSCGMDEAKAGMLSAVPLDEGRG